jgi:D-amino-acid dehydrogenase
VNAPDWRARPGEVVVVGAGIVGVTIARALALRGAAVTLVDRDEPGSGCSFGNSGAISPGSVAPLAMPGVIRSIPSMLRDRESPLYLPLRNLLPALPWLARFVAAAHPARVERSARALAELHAGAVEKHAALAGAIGAPDLLLRRGHLHVYPDEAALAKDGAAWAMRERFGFRAERLDRHGIEALEPRIAPGYRVGMFLADHATIVDPHGYVRAIVRSAAALGVRFLRSEVARLAARAGSWRVERRDDAPIDVPSVVLATGAWSRALLDPLGVAIPLETQRGYHVQFEGDAPVTRTVVLADRKVFASPMRAGLRVGGTVELAGLAAPPDERRAALLARIAREAFPGLAGLRSTTWMGHRPCTPDSVPVVGPVPGRPGLWLAVGHGHLGLTDSVNTAERIATRMTEVRATV